MVLFTGQASAQDVLLHEGTPIRLKLNRTISSATEHQGDRVDFEVLDDVKLGDIVVVPHGATALATITEAVPKARMGRGGKLTVNVDFVRLPNGDKLSLRGVQEGKGGAHTGAMAGAMVGTAIVCWPAAPLFLLMHGKDITIPQGQQVTVYTNSDYKPTTGTVAASHSTPSVSGPALTNSDIIMLKQTGFSDQLIIAKIKSTPGLYLLDTGDLMKLKEAGLSDATMSAMMDAKR
jgi:hypothetical protein